MSLQEWFGLEGKRALVTGASRGLGRAMALALARAGAEVVITGRSPGPLQATEAELKAITPGSGAILADMHDGATTAAACAEALERFGPVDILINNIGNRMSSQPIAEESVAEWDSMLGFNISPTFAASQVIGREMIARGQGGRIINIASIAALRPIAGIGGRHYETGKAAVLQFTRCLALDWAAHGITANAICPGLFMTDANLEWQQTRPEVIEGLVARIPAGRAGMPSEIGPLAVFLASPAAAFINGASFVIDGGGSI